MASSSNFTSIMASSSIPLTGPNWVELPRDVTANILQRLGTIDLLTSACQVCPIWWNIRKVPHIWRTIKMTKPFSSRYHHEDELVKICHKAIEQSCGQVEEIDIEHFATDDLLAYIADSAVNLRHMRLAQCSGLSDEVFSESVKKLPHLESLDISSNTQLSNDTFEVVGRYCPFLKTLKCSTTTVGVNYQIPDVSIAIGKTMPGLHHLKIRGEMPSYEGFHAILEGCPLLESLDLEETYYYCYLNFSRGLEKRCREKIKVFLPPTLDCSSSDYDYDWDIDYSDASG